jgi:GAF domain-containing protein/HAMP domain-containing protein
MQNSIRRQMKTAFTLLTLIPILIISFVLAGLNFQNRQTQVQELQSETAQRIAAAVSVFFSEVESNLEVVAQVHGLLTQDLETQQITLSGLRSYQNAFESLTLLDGQGQELLHVSRVGLTMPEELVSRAIDDEFTIPKASGEFYYGPVEFDEETNEPLMTVAAPLPDVRSGLVGGVLVADVRFKPVWDLIGNEKKSESENLYILDDQGRVVAHANPTKVLLQESFALGSGGYGPPQADGEQNGLDGTRVVLASEKIQLGRQTFYVVAERSWNEAILYPALFNLAIALGILGLALVMAAYIATRSIRRTVLPIEKLAAIARAISAGDLTLRAEVTQRDEVGLLAEAFNSMTAQMGDLIGGLEQRVAERTADLEQTGKELAERSQELENTLNDLQQRSAELEDAGQSQAQANRELREANRQSHMRALRLQASTQVSRTITQVHDMDKLLPQVTEHISRFFGYYHVGVFLIAANERIAELRAANSTGGQKMLSQGYNLEISAQDTVCRAIRMGEFALVGDTASEAAYLAAPELPDTRSALALPLLSGDRTIGALDVQSTDVGAFEQEDITALSSLADQVAIAIENARLIQQAQDAREEAEIVYQQVLMGQWQGLVEKRRFSPGEYRQLLSSSAQDLPLRAGEQALQKGKVVVLNDAGATAQEISELAAPIQLRGQTIGVLDLQELEGDRHWTEDDITLVREVADQVGQALEKARLFDESRRRAQREQATRQIADRIRARTEVDAMLQTAIRELAQTLQAPRVFVRLAPEALAEEDEQQNDEKTD